MQYIIKRRRRCMRSNGKERRISTMNTSNQWTWNIDASASFSNACSTNPQWLNLFIGVRHLLIQFDYRVRFYSFSLLFFCFSFSFPFPFPSSFTSILVHNPKRKGYCNDHNNNNLTEWKWRMTFKFFVRQPYNPGDQLNFDFWTFLWKHILLTVHVFLFNYLQISSYSSHFHIWFQHMTYHRSIRYDDRSKCQMQKKTLSF